MTMMIINKLLQIANEYLIPFMAVTFVIGLTLKFCVYFLKSCQLEFAKQIEKKIYQFLIEKEITNAAVSTSKNDFHHLTKEIMSIAYTELYELKKQRMRRKLDYVTTFTDRLFLLLEGAQRLIKDVALQAKYYNQHQDNPDFDQITGYANRTNPAYNRLFGFFSTKSLLSILNLLPGLFVIGGIFGTFVGIMQGLPELTNMDLTSPDMTKKTMDAFLMNIAYSMNTSLVGIVFCVLMNIMNSLWDADDLEEEFTEKLKSSLLLTWREVIEYRKKTSIKATLIEHLPEMKKEEIVSDADEPPPLKMVG